MSMEKILLAMDDTRTSEQAAQAARDLLRENPQTQLYVLYVTQLYPTKFGAAPLLGMDYEREVAAQIQTSLRKDHFSKLMNRVHFEHKIGVIPAKVICQTAVECQCDLIIVGSRGKRAISRVISGSVSRDVVLRSSIPVLVVRYSPPQAESGKQLHRAGNVVKLEKWRRI
ncbi:universal stress protein [Alicyclobacillus sp. ALC3]|uniref:universal stress protein n=1 Tax=Alicyclobacillus sp. ALC3 TaxID=2796143 RepID=UPI0023794F53|nr:universal stress protein [Alicyclobacillus sp. ALC3]WDL99251.1 universal stress protein [Alicyclobacillus sp. ALC3]